MRAFRILAIAALAMAATNANAQGGAPAGGGGGAQGRGGGGGRGRGGIRTFSLTSTAFTDGGTIPIANAQPGHDVSPPLSWSGAPDSTVSFVLVVHDIDTPIGNGNDDLLHWLVWNMPGTTTSLDAGIPQGPTLAGGMRQISATGPNYRGPAAPSTGPAHHYLFELYALDANVNVQPVGLPAPATRAAVVEAMAGHIRGKAALVGLFRRAAP